MNENKRQGRPHAAPDAEELAASVSRIAERSRELVSQFLTAQQTLPYPSHPDPLNLGSTFFEMTARLMADPARLFQAQISLWEDYLKLWQHASERLMGQDGAPVAAPAPGDRRFKDPAWSENLVFDFIKQSYLLTSRWLLETVRGVEGLDEKTAAKADFYTRQFIDALAPTNFLATNPEVLRATLESRGENLVRGLENLLEDLQAGKGKLRIRMTDESAFEVGRNVAVTPGKVVWRNDLMELIQYAPRTEQVFRRPLLVIPPWINKFYILDLKPENSFVRWALERGFTVFMISWVNPDQRLADKTFDDYLGEGPLAALDAIEKAVGERESTVIGYCLGGTLLAATLAWMEAKGDSRVKAATYFASLVDFSKPGELGVFIDEVQLQALEAKMARTGYLDADAMATTFNMLRANDLIWSFVVNNYLLGKEPFPFDLLYWNADSTRMPAAMHGFYLRKMYQENRLVEPGGIEIAGVPLDLRRIKVPSYLLATKEDHIAPWEGVYAASRLYAGPVRFVLAASGHIAGVVNPPAAHKYGYWTGRAAKGMSAEDWLAAARYRAGSWWPDWAAWNARRSGSKVAARDPAKGGLEPLGDAPGTYVKVRAV